jgi:ribosomal-protein-alanine N-acetyltransferase
VIILETPRLLFRHLELTDLDSLYALYGDPEVTRYIPDAPKTFTETQEELEWFLNGHPKRPELGLWATIHKPSGKFIGRCGLLPWTIDGQDEVEVAYAIARDTWGQGLGTEAARGILQYAFERLGLTRLICLVEQENQASIKVATHIGMVFEKASRDEIGPFLVYSIHKESPTN